MTARLGDRSLFPDLRARAYLNHAAVSPAARPVAQAAAAMVDACARDGLGALEAWRAAAAGAKARLATLIGGDAAQVALVPNTSAGVTAVAMSVDWRRGDRVLVLDGEFPANVTPWQRAARHFGLELVRLPADSFEDGGDAGFERLESELARGLRLVAASLVQFQTGLRMPWERMGRLCRTAGAELFLDGIQGLGVVPFDLSRAPVDYLVAGSHKWLMGLPGSGFLWAAPERWAAFRPRLASWLSHEDPVDFLFGGAGLLRYDKPLVQGPAMLEGGMVNALGAAALEASVGMLIELGVPAIHAHVGAYLDELEAGLVELGCESLRSPRADERSGTLAVRLPDGRDVAAAAAALAQRGVSVSTPDGLLRFSPHWPNARDELPHVLDACREALGGR